MRSVSPSVDLGPDRGAPSRPSPVRSTAFFFSLKLSMRTLAAMMLPNCAFLPDSRLEPCVKTVIGACIVD